MGCEATEKDLEYNKTLIDSVIHNDVMVDKLIIKDVQVSSFKDYFLVFSRVNCKSSTTIYRRYVNSKFFFKLLKVRFLKKFIL